MATYPGMTLGGEIRESISLDEDDLSDVEDEVFIRDGKNGYKLAEELNMKRPLMAPRKKLGKPDFTSRLRNRPPCRAFCKPCCYISIAFSVLIGIIILVVILVSLFPLPLDRLRDWIISKSRPTGKPPRLLPCSNLKVTEVWITTLPILTTDSPVRTIDIDGDGVEDIIFGFGTGDNYDILPPDIFCPAILGVHQPCEGGIIALNGLNGSIVWRYWTNDTIFSIQCLADLNADGNEDCLAIGTEGTIIAIDSRNGSLIWANHNSRMEVFITNFIPDQNNDSIVDILASHVSFGSQDGHLVLISGKTGKEIKRMDLKTQTLFMPQLLTVNDTIFVLVGTGSPGTPGNLSVIPLEQLVSGNLSFQTLYEDHYKGVITQSVLVDITGDNITDIVTSMFNSTVVAINGRTFQQIWNYTVPESETNITPTPSYFNDDNVTDFMITYEKYDNILNYNYTKTYIIDGKTGKPIYKKSISGRVSTQESGLNLQMQHYGFDMFLFWTTDCVRPEVYGNKNSGDNATTNNDLCLRQFKTPRVVKLNALNQFDQPPGFELYSINGTYFPNKISPLKQIKSYMQNHFSVPRKIPKGSNFRQNIQPSNVETYLSDDDPQDVELPLSQQPLTTNYEENYQEPVMYENNYKPNREMRSQKMNPSDGIYDYRNIKMSRNRLLHDLNNVPSVILRDTFYKNEESKLKKSKFEQRDIMSHIDKAKEKEEVKKMIEDEKMSAENASYNLWDLESEKEVQDKENGYWRGKRDVNDTFTGVPKVTSVGAILQSFNSTENTMDIVFITYWQPSKDSKNMDQQYIDECVKEKLKKDNTYTKNTDNEQENFYKNECREELENFMETFEDSDRIHQLRLGQMNVHRIKIECLCNVEKTNERCVKFLPIDEQKWSMYLGKSGNGCFHNRH